MIRAKDFAREIHGKEIRGKVSCKDEKAALKFGRITDNAFLCNRKRCELHIGAITSSSATVFYKEAVDCEVHGLNISKWLSISRRDW